MPHTHTTKRRTRRGNARGFTLAEVLISLGIFGIGMIAVASLFPVGAILQKETADDILGEQATTNALATIRAVGLTYNDPAPGADDLDDYYTASGPSTNVVLPIDTAMPNGFAGNTFFDRYTLAERSYPTTEDDTFERDYYWFFFVRDTADNAATPSWQGFVYLVDKDNGVDPNTLAGGFEYRDAGTLATPADIEPGTPYITADGKTGEWSLTGTVTGFIYYHPDGVGVETFVFNTTP